MADEVVKTQVITKVPETNTEKVEVKVESSETEGEGEKVVEQTEEQKEQERIEQENHSKKQSRLDRRFKDLTTKVRTKEADVQSLRDTLMEVTGEAPPTRGDYTSVEEYNDAVSDYREKIRGPKTLLNQAEKDHGKAEAEYNQALVESWEDKVKEIVKTVPDYSEIVKAANIPMKAGTLKAVMRSPVGPLIALHLANNQEEAYALAELPMEEQILEIGRLETKVQPGRKVAPEVKPKIPPNTPPGSKVVGEKAPSKKDPANMNLDEYSAWRKAGGGR